VKGRRFQLLTLVIAAGFLAGVVYLFGIEFAGGDVYPEYSTLRADPLGAKLLLESLAGLPGLTVTRNFLPLEFLPQADQTVVLLGCNAPALTEQAPELRQLAQRGSRVVAALAMEPSSETGKFEQAWKVKLAFDRGAKHVHKVYFLATGEWKALDRVGPKILAIERAFGKGSVVLLAESDAFSNQSTVVSDRLDFVASVIGPAPQIVFDERHFGLGESGSVIGLARRFRLTGLAIGLAVCAALFLWRNTSAFPPPAPAAVSRLSGRTSHSGLLTLLRRHIPTASLAEACWREWLASHRREVTSDRVEQTQAILRSRAAQPLDALREIEKLLKGVH
jgi:hypothetical protein